MSTFDTFGLWWMVGATIVGSILTTATMAAGKLGKLAGGCSLFWAVLYIGFYLHLLGVLK